MTDGVIWMVWTVGSEMGGTDFWVGSGWFGREAKIGLEQCVPERSGYCSDIVPVHCSTENPLTYYSFPLIGT